MLPHSPPPPLGNFPTVPKLSGTKINKPPPLTRPPKMADFTKCDMCDTCVTLHDVLFHVLKLPKVQLLVEKVTRKCLNMWIGE